MVATVIGKKIQNYTKKESGEVKTARELHVVKDPPIRPVEGFIGQEVDKIWCPFDISFVEVGERYNFIYDIKSGSKGSYATLVDIQLAD